MEAFRRPEVHVVGDCQEVTRTLPQRHDRAVVTLHDDVVVKTFSDVAAADRECTWYSEFGWATPWMVDRDGATVVIERLPLAVELPDWRPVAEMRALLERLHRCNVHHRDVHAKNVVRMPDGSPRLIDWETALIQSCGWSYDLHGPDRSGIPKPEIHARFRAQWWGGDTPFSLGRFWQ